MKDSDGQRGVALLAALILTLAVVLVLSNIFYRHQIDVAQAGASMHRDQALLLALSGESWAAQMLSDAQDDRSVDEFGEDWAQAMPLLPVEGGILTGCIADMQARINLNNFARYDASTLRLEMNSKNMGTAKVWTRLLDILEFPAGPARVARIIDWLDADSATVNSWGGEQPDYDNFRPPRVVANTRVSDVTELAAISGYEIWEVQRLAAWSSALPTDTAININTASDEILLALSGGLNEPFVDMVLENRPFNRVADFHAMIASEFLLAPADVSARWPPRIVDVKTDYFELYLDVTLGEAHIELKSIMSRRGLTEPVVISRAITLVPASLPDRVPDKLSAAEALFADEARDEEIDRTAASKIVPEPACLMIGKNS